MNLLRRRAKARSPLFALCLVLLGVSVALVWRVASSDSHQPLYKGKTVGQWMAQMHANPYDATAHYELIGMGEPAIPYLMREVRTDGGKMAQLYRWIWQRIPGAMQGHLPAPVDYLARRAAAANVLRGFGPAASNAVPALIDCLQHKEYQPLRFSAAGTLGSIRSASPDVVRALVQALSDEDFNVRMQAAIALARIGSGYSGAIPQLEAMLRSERPGEQLRSALALWRLQPTDAAASNRVAHFLLEAGDPSARAWAAILLGELGPAAGIFAPALQPALQDPDPVVRQNATSSLQSLKLAR